MSELSEFYVVLAPEGQLTGNGQLRETVSERRNRKGNDVAFWYLPTQLVREFKLSNNSEEAVVADDPTAADWVRLRFGGRVETCKLDEEKLRQLAMELPPAPEIKDISIFN